MAVLKVYEYGCKQQQEDYETMLLALDNLGAASLALVTSGAQGYTQFIDARDNFKNTLTEISKNYRYVQTE